MEQDKTLKEGEDFYFNEAGLLVFTREFLLKRGFCCKNGCTNCPYGYTKESKEDNRP